MQMHGTTPSYGPLSAVGCRFGVVRARFNDAITGRLLTTAVETLRSAGATDAMVHIIEVPGAIELPLAAQRLLRHHHCDGVLALGCVIRGETDHYAHVCRLSLDGLMRVMLDEGKPVVCGVITAETREQAEARVSAASWARTLIEMTQQK